MPTLFVVFLACAFLPAPSAFALDSHDEEALKNTKALLTDEAALKAFTKDNPDAGKALQQIQALTGGNKAQMNEVNNLSSSIFEDMVKANNGDNAAIQAQLQEALKDPAGFLKRLSPEQQARIRNLASELDKKNAPPPAK